MPYHIAKQNGKFAVMGDDGKVVGSHDTKDQAAAHMAALYAKVKDAKAETNKLMPGESRNPIPGAIDSAGGKSAGGEVLGGLPAEKEGAETFVTAMKVGAMISAANKAKLRAAHDAIKELMPECCGGEEKEEPAEVESVDSAPGKSATLPLFNYVARLHLPYDDEYMRDVVAVKSVARDTIRGYTMLWGTPELADVEAEFFTPQTDFWDKQLEGVTRPLTWDHAQDPDTKSQPVIGKIEAYGNDDTGRWYVAQLDRAHKYRAMIDKLISKRDVGTSSDSASQYVVRKSAGKAVWLAQWPWFASALTPTPAEPRMLDVGLPYWKSAGVDFARMGAPDGAQRLPDALRFQAQLLKAKAGVP